MMSTVRPHHYACFCEQCRGVPYREWIDREVSKQFGYQAQTAQKGENEMDLGKYKGSSRKGGDSERLPWLDGHCLPKKGGILTINNVREPRDKKGKTLFYMDVTLGKKKYTWSMRKGFTLDALIDELGTKTERWTGKKVKVVPGGDDGQYVNVA